ncbi:MAG: FecR family protein [Alphaproteobacteria bacterium]
MLKGLIAGLTLVALMFQAVPVRALEAGQAVAIGAAEEVENKVSGTLADQSRQLAKGDEIFANELITTDEDSTANLVFADETELAVGPLSSITLDKFVYDPDTKTGEIVFNATRGVFRFITGLGNKNIYTIKTPLATIGVQGTEFDLVIDEDGEAGVLLGKGAVRVCHTKRDCRRLHRQGHYMRMTRGKKKWSETRKWNGELKNVNLTAAFPYFAPRFSGRRMRPMHLLARGKPGRKLFRQAHPRKERKGRQGSGSAGPGGKSKDAAKRHTKRKSARKRRRTN